MNIIFLDINGVLNTTTDYDFNPNCLVNLKQLVKDTNAKIVITSAWRRYEESLNEIIKTLKTYDIEVNGTTKILHTTRSHEINVYLEEHEIEKFVILDDMIIEGFPNNLVHVDKTIGLSEEDILEAKKILQ